MWHSFVLTLFKMIVDETGMEAIVTRECMGILCIVMVVFGALMYFFVENALARQITLEKGKRYLTRHMEKCL